MPPKLTNKTMSLKANTISDRNLRERIWQEKQRGMPDLEIGRKYGVTYKYIERLITQVKGLNVSTLTTSKKVKEIHPKDFKEESSTVWSFKKRGNWATHSGEYRGNWSPYIPRNVILKYSKPGEIVLDYFCGAGTTAVEAKLLGRKCIAIDVNEKAIDLAKENLEFEPEPPLPFSEKRMFTQIYEPELLVGDARNLSFLEDNSIDLICAHPPYANIIQFTNSKDGDLSFLDIDAFLIEMSKVAKESFRVLKSDRRCAILIGDTRRKKHVIPLGFKLIDVYLNNGFKLRELFIKRQHNCKTTGFWRENSVKYNFLLLAHEYLLIFEKAEASVNLPARQGAAVSKLSISKMQKLPVRKKTASLETTTVWLFPEKDFEERLNQNVLNRYSKGNGCLAITIPLEQGNGNYALEEKNKKAIGLFFVKSPSSGNFINHDIEFFLRKIEEIISYNLGRIIDGGFVVIQIQDFRKSKYVEPLAKRIWGKLTSKSLWLKEIIIAVPEKPELKSTILDKDEHLTITHHYLLVYKKIS